MPPHFLSANSPAEATIPIIAAGGISSIEDLRTLQSSGVEGAIIGRALFDGMIDLEEAINLVR